MKTYYAFLAIVLLFLAIYGIAGPTLISAKSVMGVWCGIILMSCVPPLLYLGLVRLAKGCKTKSDKE